MVPHWLKHFISLVPLGTFLLFSDGSDFLLAQRSEIFHNANETIELFKRKFANFHREKIESNNPFSSLFPPLGRI